MSGQRRFHQTTQATIAAGLVAGTLSLPLLAAGPALAAVNLCGHPADSVPPAITSLTMSSSTLDTTAGPVTLTLTADAVDTAQSGTGSGVKRLNAEIQGPHNTYKSVKFTLASGTPQDGVWTGMTVFTDKTDWPGVYQLTDVYLDDAANNYQDYGGGKTATSPTAISLQSGWDTSLTLTGPNPPAVVKKPAGNLTSLTITPGAVNTSTAAKHLAVSAAFAGNQPRNVYVSFNDQRQPANTPKHRSFFLNARLKQVAGAWQARVTVPEWIGSQTISPQLFAVFSNSAKPRFRQYPSSRLKKLGFASQVTITSRLDTVAPTLTGFNISPTTVDTTTGAQTVAITASATDDLSGVKGIDVNLYSRSGRGIVFGAGSDAQGAIGFGGFDNFYAGGGVNVHLKKSGDEWTGVATLQECVPSGKWTVTVEPSDHANNGRYYSASKLTKLGYPSTLMVKSATQYVYDPVVTSATASGAGHQITLDFDEGVQNITTSNLSAYAVSPADTRYQAPLTISSIQCSNGDAYIDCSGDQGLITSAVLTIPSVTGGQNYEVWADLDSTTSQITDAGGLPISWTYAIAEVKGD